MFLRGDAQHYHPSEHGQVEYTPNAELFSQENRTKARGNELSLCNTLFVIGSMTSTRLPSATTRPGCLTWLPVARPSARRSIPGCRAEPLDHDAIVRSQEGRRRMIDVSTDCHPVVGSVRELSERFRPPVIAERYFLNFFCDFQTRRVRRQTREHRVSRRLAVCSTALATGRRSYGMVNTPKQCEPSDSAGLRMSRPIHFCNSPPC